MIAIKKTTPSRFYHKFFLYRQNITSFYTDGSKSQNGAVRVYVFSPEMKGSIGHKLSPKTLIFFAEKTHQAIFAARNLGQQCNVIFSDSKSVLEAIQNSLRA